MSRRTPLYDLQKQQGAKTVEFGGWEMPVQFSGITEEHLAVRRQAGLFDVSHMGEIEIRGNKAQGLICRLTPNDAARLTDGRSQYSALLTERGTFVDDIMVYRIAANHFLLCVNASNADKDFEWIRSNLIPGAEVENRSDAYALLALQGPSARKIIASSLPKNHFQKTELAGREVLLSVTGYTGEDGFEIFCPADAAQPIWSFLLEKGKASGILPCGLGARDTLRIEAAYPLYGHEIDEETNPYEANLGWIVKMEKGDFIGREALRKKPAAKKLAGLLMEESGIARAGHKIYADEKAIGHVTSGTFSPLLRKSIAMGYLIPSLTNEELLGKKIGVEIRGKKRAAVVVRLPFYKRL